MANLRDANLRGADLRGADLRYADLHDAKMDSKTILPWVGRLVMVEDSTDMGGKDRR